MFQNSKALRLRLLGGLGNQLLQISAARFAKEKGLGAFLKILIDPAAPNLTERNHTRHLRASLAVSDSERWLNGNPMRGAATLKLMGRNASQSLRHDQLLLFGRSCLESDFFSEACGHLKTMSSLCGYFQSSPALLSWIDSVRPIKLKELDAGLHAKRSEGEFAALHLRRGDYVGSGPYGQLGVDYYAAAIEQIDEARILVFSDDVSAALSLKSRLGDRRLEIFDDSGMTNIALLRKMSSSTSIVAANSTLSWWAGNIGMRKTKRFAPARWFRFDDSPSLPGGTWTLIDPNWLD